MQPRSAVISQEVLRDLFDYSPETGELRWKNPQGFSVHPGDLAGCLDRHGYISVGLFKDVWPAHRLIWCWMTGEFPQFEIDHRNRIKSDNRWLNLREATRGQNACNLNKSPKNTSGVTEVYWNKRSQKWRAFCYVRGANIHLGYYTSKEEAAKAREKHALEHHGSFCGTI